MGNKKHSHCKKGHELTQENSSIRSNGKRRCKICEIDYRVRNKDKLNATSLKWQKEHPERQREIQRKHNHKRQPEQTKYRKEVWWNPYTHKLRIETFTKYGNGKMACVCCEESTFQFLTIDHINGRTDEEKKNIRTRGWQGYQRLRASGYPEGYQTLCWNCNSGRQLNGGVCPHKVIS